MSGFFGSFLGSLAGWLIFIFHFSTRKRRRIYTCVFCNYECLKNGDMMQHIETCEKHPVHALKSYIKELEKMYGAMSDDGK